jgi:excisionase family DNA binding protein
MKTSLEKEDIEAIATEVLSMVKPLLENNGGGEDIIFDVKGLADYLKVDETWVYRQISLKTIPFFKVGKYTRFKKSAIDRWADNRTIKPISRLNFAKNSG